MRRKGRCVAGTVSVLAGGVVTAALAGCASSSKGAASWRENGPQASWPVHVAAASPEAAGKYLVQISGCNDCHTPGYSQTNGKTPVSQWLIGQRIGYRGPWGTTYASNLRLYVAPMSEEDWVHVMRARNDKPPMPWQSLHAMSDRDLRAIYRFIHSMGKAGEPTPQDLPSGQEPRTPYVVFDPPTAPR
ncbi:MAG TPA: hypothetical protein VN541_19815 [Tepidisphaeraceae bacterium]|nr:hypothetical protein [Tepidisphaeraceae bacterium]